MGPKKGRRVRKIEVPTDKVPEFELGDSGREASEREEARREEARKDEASHLPEGVAEKRSRTDKSDTETEVEERWEHHDTRRGT